MIEYIKYSLGLLHGKLASKRGEFSTLNGTRARLLRIQNVLQEDALHRRHRPGLVQCAIKITAPAIIARCRAAVELTNHLVLLIEQSAA